MSDAIRGLRSSVVVDVRGPRRGFEVDVPAQPDDGTDEQFDGPGEEQPCPRCGGALIEEQDAANDEPHGDQYVVDDRQGLVPVLQDELLGTELQIHILSHGFVSLLH